MIRVKTRNVNTCNSNDNENVIFAVQYVWRATVEWTDIKSQEWQPTEYSYHLMMPVVAVYRAAMRRRYDTIRDAILTCARKPTWVSLIYRTETTTKKCKTEKLKSKKRICSEVTVKVWGITTTLQTAVLGTRNNRLKMRMRTYKLI